MTPTQTKPAERGIPREIWICGSRCPIIHMSFTSFALGYYNHDAGEIQLNAECSIEVLREVLWHEILHAIDFMLLEPGNSITGTIEAQKRTDEKLRLEETAVLALSRGQFMTMTDPRNLEAMDWILGRSHSDRS